MAFTTQQNVVLLPIKPKYAHAIFTGEKTVEFRKQQFKRPVSHIVVYASSPEKKVLGYVELGEVDEGRPMTIWRKHRHEGAISFQEYKAYFKGKDQAVAIGVKKTVKLDKPISLGRLRRGLRAPQSYCYIDKKHLDRLVKNEAGGRVSPMK